LGKSPLRLIRSRTWHNESIFSDLLECGHSVRHVALFDYDELGHIVNLQPTAKRRRCQKCAEIARGAKKPAASVVVPFPFRLYADCRAEIRKKAA